MRSDASKLKFKPWPNGLGVSAQTRRGAWDVFLAEFSKPFTALFFPHGECTATKCGRGDSPENAIRNAKMIVQD